MVEEKEEIKQEDFDKFVEKILNYDPRDKKEKEDKELGKKLEKEKS